MSLNDELASAIERTVTGPMWHGPTLRDVLHGITGAQAAARPVVGAHSVWELVLHVTAWCDIVRTRLHGGSVGNPTDEEDWPHPPAVPSADAWRAAVDRLERAHRELAAAVRLRSESELLATVATPTSRYSIDFMLRGVVEHGTYHGGQIALLRRAITSSAAAAP